MPQSTPWNTATSISLCQSTYYYRRRHPRSPILNFHPHSISLFRLPNATFELRIHLHLPCSAFSSAESLLAKADVELTPNGEHLLVSGSVRSTVGMGVAAGAEQYAYGCAHGGPAKSHPDTHGTLVWTDQPCGRFGRGIPLGFSPGTEVCPLFESVLIIPVLMRLFLCVGSTW